MVNQLVFSHDWLSVMALGIYFRNAMKIGHMPQTWNWNRWNCISKRVLSISSLCFFPLFGKCINFFFINDRTTVYFNAAIRNHHFFCFFCVLHKMFATYTQNSPAKRASSLFIRTKPKKITKNQFELSCRGQFWCVDFL